MPLFQGKKTLYPLDFMELSPSVRVTTDGAGQNDQGMVAQRYEERKKALNSSLRS
jgi:hypothetical protein